MAENKKQGQSMLNGAFVLVVATVLVKVIGALYKIPLTGLIGEVGRGYFNAAYEIYTPLYAISMAGLPVAVSKTVSQERALGHYRDVKIIMRTARRIFLMTGIIATVLLFAIAYPYSRFVIKAPENFISIMEIYISTLCIYGYSIYEILIIKGWMNRNQFGLNFILSTFIINTLSIVFSLTTSLSNQIS